MSSLSIIFASGSGHTEYVVSVLTAYFKEKAPQLSVTVKRAEQADAADFFTGDILLLASGTWNTGGIEGQLQPYMFELLNKRAKDVALDGKHCTCIALGDERYFYTARAGEHMRKFLVDHGGKIFMDPLAIINQPYGQEEKVKKWGEAFLKKIPA